MLCGEVPKILTLFVFVMIAANVAFAGADDGKGDDQSLMGKAPDEMAAIIERAKGEPIMVGFDQGVLIQSRVATSDAQIKEYTDCMRRGDTFPPGKGIFDKETNELYITGGIHRRAAHQLAGHDGHPVIIRFGTKAEAYTEAAMENRTHGLARSNKDKVSAVKMLFMQPENRAKSDAALAKMAGVSAPLVAKIRDALVKSGELTEEDGARMVVRNGQTYMMAAPKKTTTAKTSEPREEADKALKSVQKATKTLYEKLTSPVARNVFAQELVNWVRTTFPHGIRRT